MVGIEHIVIDPETVRAVGGGLLIGIASQNIAKALACGTGLLDKYIFKPFLHNAALTDAQINTELNELNPSGEEETNINRIEQGYLPIRQALVKTFSLLVQAVPFSIGISEVIRNYDNNPLAATVASGALVGIAGQLLSDHIKNQQINLLDNNETLLF